MDTIALDKRKEHQIIRKLYFRLQKNSKRHDGKNRCTNYDQKMSIKLYTDWIQINGEITKIELMVKEHEKQRFNVAQNTIFNTSEYHTNFC